MSYKSYNFFLLWNTKGKIVLIVFSVISYASLFLYSILVLFFFLQTSIFIPSYGATTNVHINSKMTTQEVITQLLLKFKVGIIITTGNSIHKPLNDYMCLILFCWTGLIILTLNFETNSLITLFFNAGRKQSKWFCSLLHSSKWR